MISPNLRNRILRALKSCPAMSNRTKLLSVFSDGRLAQWRSEALPPDTMNAEDTANAVVVALLKKWDDWQQNGLALLLCVLGEQEHNRDLAELAEEVRQEFLQQEVEGLQRELELLETHEREGDATPDYAARRRAQLQNKIQMLETEKAKPAPCQIDAQQPGFTVTQRAEEHYTDLEIHISEEWEEGRYTVIAELDGEGKHSGVLQMGTAEQQGLLEKTDPAEYGVALYDALFTGDILNAYTKACERARSQNHDRLRLRLWIDHNAAELHALIWERLHDRREGGAFRITTDAKRPFSRYFGLQGAESAAIAGKARMLCILSNPQNLAEHGLAPLDGNAEAGNLLVALEQLIRAGVEVTIMPGQAGLSAERRRELKAAGCAVNDGPSTLDHVFEQLAYAPGYDLVHFVGHGIFNSRRDQAALLLEDKAGQVARATDTDLTGRLAGVEHKPSLIFLAACESAARPAGNVNPFVGLAPRLVQIGIPAVIAMQSAVEIEPAQKLTQHFYRFLLDHGIVDKALNQARGFLVGDAGWDVPVLFMRLREGRLIKRD
ncbi:MAG: CHAT domain-containing protein [Anaerolineae bacterium]|nr:CHAT domain-containing protein [Anaerolineae bacterium]